jgi:hypothetical protein
VKTAKALATPPVGARPSSKFWTWNEAARNASGRRRSVDPTTCDRDYSPAEWEFMQAVREYKQRSGRMFPTWSEALEVLRGLGYAKPAG